MPIFVVWFDRQFSGAANRVTVNNLGGSGGTQFWGDQI
jgi:hypothetical protein